VLDAPTPRVVFGVGAVDRVADEVAGLGVERALVIGTRAADQVADDLGPRLATRCRDTRQHVPEELADATTKVAAEASVDGIVAVGGGSAIGLGKAVAVTTGALLVAVPTTYSGSEMTPVYGITGTHKRTGRDERARPRVVVYDPALTVGLPPAAAGPSGLNALAHCVEALYGPTANPVGDLYALEGARLLATALPAVVDRPDDLAARADALLGAQLAGMAFTAGGSALHHKLCHVLGGTFRLVHGEVNAVVLPQVAAFNAVAVPDALARVAAALGGPADPDAAGGLLYDLAARLGAPTSLAQLGLPCDSLHIAAGRAADELAAPGPASNPRPVDEPSLWALLKDAFYGRRP